MSQDDGLIIELGPVLGDRYRTNPIDGPDDLAASPPTRESFIILDAVEKTDARAIVARLESLCPAAPIIVIATAGDESQWGTTLTRGGIIAVVARDALGGPALKQALERTEARLRTQENATAQGSTASGGDGRQRMMLLAGGGALLALVAILGLWLALRGGDQAAPQTVIAADNSPSGAVATPAGAATDPGAKPALSALELLSAARVAFANQKLLPKPDADLKGDSALELYVQAITLNPGSEEARDGVRRLFNVARTRIQSDLSAGRFDEVGKLLNLFHAAGMEGEATAGIEADVAAAKPRWLAARVRSSMASGDIPAAEQELAQLAASGGDKSVLEDLRKDLEARRQDMGRETRLTELATSTRAAIVAGNLLDPASSNARAQLQAMRQISRTSATTVAVQHEYATALLARAREESRSQQFDTAQRLIAAATEAASAAELADAKRTLQTDMDAAAQRAAAAAAAAATPEVVKSKPPVEPVILTPRPTRPLEIEYPAQAEKLGVGGYVVLEFMLQPDGSATDVLIVESRPKKIFDMTAIKGVARGHFDTSELGPEQKPQRARIRLTFKK
jgi:TonB family protein